MTTANDYIQHRLDFVSEMHTAVESLGKIYEAMPGSPWSDKIAGMILEITEMIDTTDTDLNASGVAQCMNCNGRTHPVNLTYISRMHGKFCTACTKRYTDNRPGILSASGVQRF